MVSSLIRLTYFKINKYFLCLYTSQTGDLKLFCQLET